jgi:prevent-host-death family protein
MRISVAEAKDQLDDLVRRAEAGDEVILTGLGDADVRLVPEPRKKEVDTETRLAIIAEIQASAAKKAKPGPSAARSQDFLYDEYGLPK